MRCIMAWRHLQKMRWVFCKTTQRFDSLHITCISETYVFIVQSLCNVLCKTQFLRTTLSFDFKYCFVRKRACPGNREKRWRIPNVNQFNAFINGFYSTDHPICIPKRFSAISSIMMYQSLVLQGMKIKHIMSLNYVVIIVNSLMHIVHFLSICHIKSSSN